MRKLLLSVLSVACMLVLVVLGARSSLAPLRTNTRSSGPSQIIAPSLSAPYNQPGPAPSKLVLDSKEATPQLIHQVGQPLLFAADPALRSDAAAALATLARRCQETNPKGALHEPQMLDLLSTALDKETNADVKRTIIAAIADFRFPEAATILNRAAADPNPAIREAAREAKIKRDRKLAQKVSG